LSWQGQNPAEHHQLSARHIIDLGVELASFTDLNAQNRYLLDFLKTHFDCQAYIQINFPNHLTPVEKNKIEFPSDLESTSFADKLTEIGVYQIEADNAYWAVAQLISGEQQVGRIVLTRERSLDHTALENLQDISRLAGPAMYAMLQSDLQYWRQKQLALVEMVSERISQVTDLDVLTQQITDLVQTTFNYNYVAVFLTDKVRQRLYFKASTMDEEHPCLPEERPEFESPNHPGFALGEHMIGFVAQTGQELIANDVAQEPRYKEVDSLADTQAEVVLPLIIEDDVLGVFDVQAEEQNAFDENDLIVLRALADNIAIAINRARLYQGLKQRIDQLAAVSEVSRAITTNLDTDDLLKQIVKLIQERFNYPYVHLFTIDHVQEKIVFKAGAGERTPIYENLNVSFDMDAEIGVLAWVVRHGVTKRITDVSQDPLFIKSINTQEAIGSELALPLDFGGEILGVLDIQSNQTNAFSEDDQYILETLADNIAVAIRNARLYKSERWRRQVAESLRDVAVLLSENAELTDILDEILEKLQKNLPCDIGAIWLFDPDEPQETPLEARKLHLAAHRTSDDIDFQSLDHLEMMPDAWIKHALSQKTPKIRQPDESIGPIAQKFAFDQDYSSIAAPLITGDESLGLLTLVHHSPGRYGLESEKITTVFASYAAITVKNTRLFKASQEQAWISTILLEVAKATQSLSNLDELASTIVRITPMVAGIKGCALFLREPESDIFSLYAMYGIGNSDELLNLDRPMPLTDAPIFDQLLSVSVPLQVTQPKQDLNLPDELSQAMSQDTLVLFPLIAHEEILGAFLLANEENIADIFHHPNQIDEERLRIIQGIIQQTAIAVDNIRLIESKQEEAYVSAVLLQAAQAAVSSADLHDTLESIVHIMPILVGIDSSVIYMWDKVEQVFRVEYANTKDSINEEELLQSTYALGDFPMLDAVFQNNHPIVHPLVDNILPPEDWDLALPDESQTDPNPILQSRYPLLLGFPLSMQDDVFGVLISQDKNIFTNRERRYELLWGMAQQASLAIQNDILNREIIERQHLEREFQLAREIQQTFLPDKVLEIPGWEMDVRWETARQVGGDFYDYFMLNDHQLAIIIADVSDKGLAASLYMTVTRTLLRAAALESDSPAETLEQVNKLLLVNSQDGLFVTAFYGILSLDDGAMTYAIAGHNPPLMVRCQGKKVFTFDKGGIALGALPDIHLEDRQVKFDSGDCLVLYTDGVTEAFNADDQMYGEDRLIRLLQTSIGKNAHSVLEILEADLEAFRANAPLSDDTTILAVCRSSLLADDHREMRSA